MSVVGPDGHVISSSQQRHPVLDAGESMWPMVGIILSVQPSDSKDNLAAENHPWFRGARHECTVLAATNYGQPDSMFHNVILPPNRHSGFDNFEEDLPRGVSSVVDGKVFDLDLYDVDYTTLDGEWCVLSFIGGNIDHPFVSAWWPHPSNNFDPATSGFGHEEEALVQCDLTNNRTRWVRRKNGTILLVNRKGSVYLDTTQADRKIEVKEGKPTVTNSDNGGHVQVDMKKKAQFEINWNEKKDKGPRIGAGSSTEFTVQEETLATPATGTSSAVHDEDLPHLDQPIDSKTPQDRPTERTFIRGKEYEVLAKTSKLILAVEAGGGCEGEVDLLVDKLIKLKCGDDIVFDSPKIHLGNDDAMEPLVLGNLWVDVMSSLIDAISNIVVSTAVGPSIPPVVNKAQFDAIKSLITNKTHLSDFVFSKKVHT